MKRKNFLLSLPLIGMAVKALSKTEEPKPMFDEKRLKERRDYLLKYPLTERECFPKNDRRIVTFKKCDDGKFLIHDNQTGETTRGNMIWTEDHEIKLV